MQSRDYQWLQRHTKKLLSTTEKIRLLEPRTYNPFHDWSVVKLITLLYFVNIYTPIIHAQKKRWVNQMRYIELLSGSGLSRIIETGDYLAGSPVISTDLARRKFDEVLLVELNEVYSELLGKRMKKLDAKFTIYNDDCNSAIPKIIEKLGEKDHYLAFIDCQSGMEIKWSTIQALLSENGDLIINFQTANIFRSVGQWQKNPEIKPTKLNEFYGDERWKSYTTREECLDGYMQKIKDLSTREIVIPLHIQGPKSYYYDLILATRKTRGGSPWIKPVEELRERLTRIGPGIMEEVLDIVKGRQKTLNGFSNPPNK